MKKPHPILALTKPMLSGLDMDAERLSQAEELRDVLRKGQNANSRRAYESDIRHWSEWCEIHQLAFLPAYPSTVATYITRLANGNADDFGKRTISTIGRRLASISKQHALARLDDPTKDRHTVDVWKSLRRSHWTKQQPKTALRRAGLAECVATIATDHLIGTRNKALLLMGWGGAFRRSELVAIKVEDLAFHKKGVVVTIQHSKTNQEGQLERIVVLRDENLELCPVEALQQWLDKSGITSGWVFVGIPGGGDDKMGGKPLHGNDVARIVKLGIDGAGIDESKKFAGHSLRSGYATSRAMEGASRAEIMRQTRHKSPMMVERYIQDGELLERAGEKVERMPKVKP